MSSCFAESLRRAVVPAVLLASATASVVFLPAGARGVVEAGSSRMSVPTATVVSRGEGRQADDAGAALRAAASRGELETVRSLLGAGADVDAANEYGATPLILASMRGHTEIARLLLQSGADAELADSFYGRTPLGWATEGGFEEIVSLLFGSGAGGFDDLFGEAVNAGDAERVARLLQLHVPAAEVLSAALEQATTARNEALARVLVEAGAVPPPPEIIDVGVELLRLYEGNYVDEVGFELAVVADEQTRALLLRPPGVRNPLRFLAVEEATFISEQSESIYVRFVVRDGRVVSMSFTQAGSTRRMTKR